MRSKNKNEANLPINIKTNQSLLMIITLFRNIKLPLKFFVGCMSMKGYMYFSF